MVREGTFEINSIGSLEKMLLASIEANVSICFVTLGEQIKG